MSTQPQLDAQPAPSHTAIERLTEAVTTSKNFRAAFPWPDDQPLSLDADDKDVQAVLASHAALLEALVEHVAAHQPPTSAKRKHAAFLAARAALSQALGEPK